METLSKVKTLIGEHYDEPLQYKLDSNSADINSGLGTSYIQKGMVLRNGKPSLQKDTGKALYHLTKAISLDSSNSHYWANLSCYYYYRDNISAAYSSSLKALQLDSSIELNWHGVGRIFMNLETYEQAIPYFEKAVQLNPDFTQCYFDLAFAYEALDLIPQAIYYYNIVAREAPSYYVVYTRMANIYLRYGEYKEAKYFFKKSYEIDSNNLSNISNMAIVSAYLKDFTTGDKYIGKLEKLNLTKNTFIYRPLGAYYLKSKNIEKAKYWLHKALRIESHNPEIPYCLASAYSIEKNKAQAIKYLIQTSKMSNEVVNHAKTDVSFQWMWEDSEFKMAFSSSSKLR
ncbi:MAG: hypothetical protein JNK00_13010 [Flavipsychrobacter sp.]|nr:hypothetical protein [Flavipsychrobacter sp.]